MPIPSPSFFERRIANILLTIALAATAGVVWQRWDFEGTNRQVELAYPEARLMDVSAKAGDLSMLDKFQGLTLVREPYTLDTMIRYGLAEAWHPKPDSLEIQIADSRLTGSAAMYLAGQVGPGGLSIRFRGERNVLDVRLPAPVPVVNAKNFILEIPAGPMPAGFRRALYLPAGDWGPAQDLDQFVQTLSGLRPDVVIPDWHGGAGSRIFFRAYLNTTWLRRPAIALPELTLPWLARRAWRGLPLSARTLVPAHLLLDPKIKSLSGPQLRQRLVRAVRERGIRFLYLALPWAPAAADDLRFIEDVKRDLIQAGFTIGEARNPPWQRVSPLAQGLIYAGIGALLFFLLWQMALWAVGFTGKDADVDRLLTIRLKPAHFRWAALGTILVIIIIHSEGPAGWGAKAAAFLLALLAPLMGLSSLEDPAAPSTGRWPWIRDTLVDFGRILGWSAAGGLGIAALLFAPEFLLRLDGFAGVKAAYVLPLAAAAIYLFPQAIDRDWWSARFRPGRRGWTLAGMAVIAVGLAVLLIRSGQTHVLPIPGWETAARDWLEQALGVRPRVKEFLLGYPCLLLGLAGRRLPGGAEKVWPKVLIAIGMLGPVSLINTFCHVHTPLAVSAARIAIGLGLGLGLGGAILPWLWPGILPAIRRPRDLKPKGVRRAAA